MVVVALNRRRGLLETDVIEASEGGSADVLDGVIWNQELFLYQRERQCQEGGGSGSTDRVRLRSAHLPPHKNVVAVVQLLVVKVIRVEALGVLAKWLEFALQRDDEEVAGGKKRHEAIAFNQ